MKFNITVAHTAAYIATTQGAVEGTTAIKVQSLIDPEIYEMIEQVENGPIVITDGYTGESYEEPSAANIYALAADHVDTLTADVAPADMPKAGALDPVAEPFLAEIKEMLASL